MSHFISRLSITVKLETRVRLTNALFIALPENTRVPSLLPDRYSVTEIHKNPITTASQQSLLLTHRQRRLALRPLRYYRSTTDLEYV